MFNVLFHVKHFWMLTGRKLSLYTCVHHVVECEKEFGRGRRYMSSKSGGDFTKTEKITYSIVGNIGMTILVILYVQLVHFLYKVVIIDANPADVRLSDVK